MFTWSIIVVAALIIEGCRLEFICNESNHDCLVEYQIWRPEEKVMEKDKAPFFDLIEMTKTDDVKILEESLKALSEHFDAFISSCMDANGKPAAPSNRDLMRARACLPPRCKNALQKN